LSLVQLKRLVDNMPRVEPTPYAFTYEDASTFEEELEEWFSYSVEEQAMILKAQSSFAQEWGSYNGLVFINGSAYEEGNLDWATTADEQREEFVRKILAGIQQTDANARLKNLEAAVYLILGCWYETAGQMAPVRQAGGEAEGVTSSNNKPASDKFALSRLQIEWIRKNVQMILDCGGLEVLFSAMRRACLRTWYVISNLQSIYITDYHECSGLSDGEEDSFCEGKEAERRELWCTMTSMYIFLEISRVKEKDGDLGMRGAIGKIFILFIVLFWNANT
jgi:hypothetical protein